MIDFRKVFNFNIVSIIVVVALLTTDTAYGINSLPITHLRKLLDYNSYNTIIRRRYKEMIFSFQYTPLIKINENKRVFTDDQGVDLKAMFEVIPETVIDKQTLELIQIFDLHKALDYTITSVGSATLFRSLMQPPTSLKLILAKQESVRELESNVLLRKAMAEYLKEFRKGEAGLFKFINNSNKVIEYSDFKAAMKAGISIAKAAQSIPTPQSDYLKSLVNEIKAFENSPVYKLMRGPIYRTFGGLRSKEDVRFFRPDWRFRPSRLTFGTVGPFVLFIGLTLAIKTGFIQYSLFLASLGVSMMMMVALSFAYGAIAKISIDNSTVVEPLREKSVSDDAFVSAVDSIGKLDELMSFIAYAEAMPHPTVLPTVTDGDKHFFIAKDLRNPILSKENIDYVPVDISLDGVRLTFITGPNNGGKTTLLKTIFQNQLSGQIGDYAVGLDLCMTIVDRMAYQAPQFDVLQNEEGRFGTELKRTQDIFEVISSKSLVVLDELAGGTTFEESLEVSKDILDGFYIIGNNTILITHNHALVDIFKNKGKGQFLQVEFKDEKPTYKVVPGISKTSHASKVAEKIGFSISDIEESLLRRGYLNRDGRNDL